MKSPARAPFAMACWVVSLGLLFTAAAVAQVTPDASANSPTEAYQFLLFWKNNDAATAQARQTLADFISQSGGPHGMQDVRVGDPAHQSLVQQYGVARAPMPLIVVVAPNGAVTEAIMHPIDQRKLTEAIVSPAAADCLKGVQEKKIVFVCATPADQAAGDAPFAGVQQFVADEQYREATRIVRLDVSDPREASFMKQLELDPQASTPVTVMLAPAGALLGKFEGKATKEQFVAKLKASQSGCCPGGKCGPGGCCPAK